MNRLVLGPQSFYWISNPLTQSSHVQTFENQSYFDFKLFNKGGDSSTVWSKKGGFWFRFYSCRWENSRKILMPDLEISRKNAWKFDSQSNFAKCLFISEGSKTFDFESLISFLKLIGGRTFRRKKFLDCIDQHDSGVSLGLPKYFDIVTL